MTPVNAVEIFSQSAGISPNKQRIAMITVNESHICVFLCSKVIKGKIAPPLNLFTHHIAIATTTVYTLLNWIAIWEKEKRLSSLLCGASLPPTMQFDA